MFEQTLASVFVNAALPQKVMLTALAGAVPLSLAAAVLGARAKTRDSRWRRVVSALRGLGPALGLLTGAMTSFHMGQTIQRLPFDPTAKQLAPGILEVSALIGLGALVGVVAASVHVGLGWADARERSPRNLASRR